MDLNTQYRRLLIPLVEQEGNTLRKVNDRTGTAVGYYPDPQVITLRACGGQVPVPCWRKFAYRLPFAEALWQLRGTMDVSWLNKHAPTIWQPYLGEDELLEKAYGVRWYPQLSSALEHLTNYPSSRQVYVSTWDHAGDMVATSCTPMPPCILGMHLQLGVYDELTMTVFSRSCDIVIGLPHDVMNLRTLQIILANSMNKHVGDFHLVLSNLHLYEPHVRGVRNLLYEVWEKPKWLSLKKEWTWSYVVKDDVRDQLVNTIAMIDTEIKAPYKPFTVIR